MCVYVGRVYVLVSREIILKRIFLILTGFTHTHIHTQTVNIYHHHFYDLLQTQIFKL